VRLIAVDIPGTGLAHRVLLRRAYGVNGVLEDWEDRPVQPDSLFQSHPAEWRRRTRRLFREERRWPPAVTGHFWVGKYTQAFPDAQVLTWVREPVARLYDVYRHWVEHPELTDLLPTMIREQRLSFVQAAELPEMQDHMRRVFLRGHPLANFAFIGVFEHQADDLEEMASFLDWYGDLPPVDDVEPRPVSAADAQRVRELNPLDVELYEHALKLRRRRLAG
jgi:hypothetical protein